MHDDLKEFEESLARLVPREMDPARCRHIVSACEQEDPMTASSPGKLLRLNVPSWVWAVAAIYMLCASVALIYNLTKTPDPLLPAPTFTASEPEVLEVMPDTPRQTLIDGPSLANVPPSISEGDLYERIATREEVLDRQSQGIVNVSNVGPVRQMRVRKVNHDEWRNRQTGERFTVSQPSEEVIYVRVSPF
jgi:hypothetical protein